MSDFLQSFLRESRGTQGIYSVCSAHAWVIEAAMRQANADGTHLLLEATSNQVNQMGGYTGMTPALFRDYVYEIAHTAKFDLQRLILGGDHLGPNPWQHLDAKTAMNHAEEMVRNYVEAGFSKIHLDASMRCADDPEILPDAIMAQRAAALCSASESVAKSSKSTPTYVIGTEVPVPGGATQALDILEVTGSDSVEQTLAIHHDAFRSASLEQAWEHVIAIVVQPGVEFDHDRVINYDASKSMHLQSFLQAHPELVMEAHSSDYQKPRAYSELIRDGFAILKVGPALTFSLRETLYSLAGMERELLPISEQSRLIETMEQTMLAHPQNWRKYYDGDAHRQQLLRVHSYSDRIRYYWRFPEVQHAVAKLIANLRRTGLPEMMLSQYCPIQYAEIREGRLQSDPREIVIANIQSMLRPYSEACLGDRPTQINTEAIA